MQTGFSLVSVLVSVAIVGVLMSLAMVNLSFLDRLIVRSELQALYATCCYAQQVAQAHQAPCTIVCDAVRHTYTCNGHVRALPASIMFGTKPGVYGPPSTPTTLVGNPITFSNATIRAAESGVLSAGTIYMVDKNKRYQYALSCSVSQVSYIRCYRYDNGFHILT